ncbi:MAG: hypothetical protein U5L11_04530 [Arhodomonas sp.]|nr:hypothetical protein [Arhodomonas sp.]
MNLLSDPAVIAINDLILRCQINAAHHHYTAELLPAGAAARFLRGLAADREATAQALSRRLLALGALPEVADRELDSLHELGDRLRARLSAHPVAKLLGERGDDEAALAAATRHALGARALEPLHPAIRRLGDDAAACAAHLRALEGG